MVDKGSLERGKKKRRHVKPVDFLHVKGVFENHSYNF